MSRFTHKQQDLLADQRPHAVLAQMQLLRRCTQRLPVIYTIRSRGQCGAFEDDPGAIFDLLKWGEHMAIICTFSAFCTLASCSQGDLQCAHSTHQVRMYAASWYVLSATPCAVRGSAAPLKMTQGHL